MTPRTDRARFLGEQLTATMRALGEATRGTDALLFLDRLARLEVSPRDERPDDLDALIEEAAAARAEHAEALGAAAGRGLDLDRFLDRGRHLDDEGDGARAGWLRDLALLATVLPWLSPSRRALAEAAFETALGMVLAEPEAFLEAAGLAFDRQEHEHPELQGEALREVLATLADLPLLLLFDRNAGPADEARVDAALAAAGEAAVEAADDALDDLEIRRNLRLSSGHRGFAVHAAEVQGFPFCRMGAGIWELVLGAGPAALRWSPDGEERDVSVEVLAGGAMGPIPANAAGEFSLPATTEALTLRLLVGPDSRVVRLERGEG